MKAHISSDCVGCGGCLSGLDGKGIPCAIELHDGRARVREDYCKGCGACVEMCGVGAIRMIGDLVPTRNGKGEIVGYQREGA